MALRKRSLIQLLWVVPVLWFTMSASGQVTAGELSPELRRQIIDAGMAPWNGGRISLDDSFRGPNREKVSLRQFAGKPLLAYNYAQW